MILRFGEWEDVMSDAPVTVTVLARFLEGLESRLTGRIDGLNTRLDVLSRHIDGLGQRFDKLKAEYRPMVSAEGIEADRPEQ